MDKEVVIILSIVTVLVAFLNIFCIAVIWYTKRLHKAAHMAISSLLFAHAIQGLVVIPSYAIKRAKISKDHRICDTFRFSYFFTNYASCLSLLAISVDRCLGVLFPLKYKLYMTTRKMLITLSILWSYVFILAMIPFALTDSKKCKYVPNKEWTLAMLLGHTLLPFIIIVFCYAIILSKVKKIIRARKSQRSATYVARQRQWDRSKTSIIIVVVYIVCWGPSLFYYTILMLCPQCFEESWGISEAEQYVTFSMKLLTFLDGLLAPLIYCFNNKRFILARQTLMRQLKLKAFSRYCFGCLGVEESREVRLSKTFYTSERSSSTAPVGRNTSLKNESLYLSRRRRAIRQSTSKKEGE